MATNPYKNKVIYDGQTLIDLTGDTVTADSLRVGVTAHNAAGEVIVGTFEPYPVGSIYMSVSSTDPATLFGGTWERIKDAFLLSAGDTYAAGATGGSASHYHNYRVGWRAWFRNIITEDTRLIQLYNYQTNSWTTGGIDSSLPNSTARNSGLSAGTTSVTNADKISATAATSSGSNMPPYLAVYVWKRTA